MSINKSINFSKTNNAKVLFNGTKQWEVLHKMNESEWKAYTTLMAKKKILVEYDAQTNAYIAKPIKETSMPNAMPIKGQKNQPQYLLQDDEMDMESDAMELINSIDLSSEPVSTPTPTSVPVAATPTPAVKPDASINLSQFEELLNKILGGSKGEIEVPESSPQVQSEELTSFLGNPLDSEFDVNDDSIAYLDSKSESYQASIDPKYASSRVTPQSCEPTNNEEFLDESPDLEDVGEQEYEKKQSRNYQDRMFAAGATGVENEDYEEEEEEELNEYENSEMEYFGNKTGQLSEYENSEEEYFGNKTGTLTEDGSEDDFSDDSSFPDEDEVIGDEEEEEEVAPVTKSGMANVGGQPVQIILTGVMITPSEVGFVAESAKKAGMRLKAVKGKGKIVNFIVENSGKQYTIKYEDMPKNRTKTPFSINKYTFQTLDEALNRINYAKTQKINEAKNFKKLIGGELATREITGIKESTVLSDFKGKISKDYIPGWNVKAVGTINLKNGLNETYSNITEHSEEKNVLVKTKDGQFFMMKGNLKERSDIGTKRNLIDIDNKKDFGIGTVVGIFENSIKGLGQIMYKVKKTTLPLLTWK